MANDTGARLVSLFLIVCVFCGGYLVLVLHQGGIYKNTLFDSLRSRRGGSSQPPLIVVWTTVFGQPLSVDPYGMCPNRQEKCVVTHDRELQASADVVVFHARDLPSHDVRLGLPFSKPTGQFWVLWNMEPPINTPLAVYSQGENFFDFDANYMQDSEIYIPYGSIVDTASPHIDSNQTMFERFQRQKGAFWMVSNCHTESNREEYVRELSAYFPVDTYGKCGSLRCDDSPNAPCMQHLSEKYMFYLSFENSLCPDYVTEKLFRTLNYPVIPVMLSGDRDDALNSLNAFVDASKYSPPELALKLYEIADNFALYTEYFEWRKTKSLGVQGWFPFCQLCDALLSETPLRRTRYNQVMRYDECRRWDRSLRSFRGPTNRDNVVGTF